MWFCSLVDVGKEQTAAQAGGACVQERQWFGTGKTSKRLNSEACNDSAKIR
jgi:hypothetical protein